jgi:glutamine amidotransferase
MSGQGKIVGLIDYQAGNIQSITNAIDYLGAQSLRIRSSADLNGVTHLLLPGVGAFGYCADRLRASGLLPAVEEWTFEKKRPILGICVGMQLLADSSDELGIQQGLGWAGGFVARLQSDNPTIRVPHVGWNTVEFGDEFGEYHKGDCADFYFDHSYAYATPTHGHTVASCTHGRTFSAVIRRDNLIAAQFHPEKSQAAGMKFLRSFLAM